MAERTNRAAVIILGTAVLVLVIGIVIMLVSQSGLVPGDSPVPATDVATPPAPGGRPSRRNTPLLLQMG